MSHVRLRWRWSLLAVQQAPKGGRSVIPPRLWRPGTRTQLTGLLARLTLNFPQVGAWAGSAASLGMLRQQSLTAENAHAQKLG